MGLPSLTLNAMLPVRSEDCEESAIMVRDVVAVAGNSNNNSNNNTGNDATTVPGCKWKMASRGLLGVMWKVLWWRL